MKILLLHNYYQQSGGEDAVVEQEKALLESKGHQVRLLTVSNDVISNIPLRAKAALGTIYSRRSRVQVEQETRSFHPEIVHIHNFFPLLSPSVYSACKAAGVPVVQTLHNFRLICPNALLFRDGKPCELCIGKTVPWPAIVHACYRESRVGSAAVASMLAVHGLIGTWKSTVEAYIALTNFAREKLTAGGLPADRLLVKPNFVSPDPGPGRSEQGFALIVGRLAPEKGISTLLSAWSRLNPTRKLKIVGDGPLDPVIRAIARNLQIEYLGRRTKQAVLDVMASASFLVFPSECYEGFPQVIVESFAKALPVVASQLGSMAELIDHGRTGLLFQPGDPQALANAVEWMFTHPVQLAQMSQAARSEFEAKYTADRNYERLMEIYQYASKGSASAGSCMTCRLQSSEASSESFKRLLSSL